MMDNDILSHEEKRRLPQRNAVQVENDYLREYGGILYDQVQQTLAALKRDGYHLSIVSNCQKGYIEAFLDHYDLWELVEDIECYGNNLRQRKISGWS